MVKQNRLSACEVYPVIWSLQGVCYVCHIWIRRQLFGLNIKKSFYSTRVHCIKIHQLINEPCWGESSVNMSSKICISSFCQYYLKKGIQKHQRFIWNFFLPKILQFCWYPGNMQIKKNYFVCKYLKHQKFIHLYM